MAGVFPEEPGESGETPSVFFTQRKTPHQYGVTWEDAPGAAPVKFTVPLKPGDTIDNETLRAIFSCGAEGTMRHSSKTGSLVIVSDHTTSPYLDTWVNAFFHYTGRGLEETREELLRRKANVSGPGTPGSGGPHSLKGHRMHEGVSQVRKQEPLAPAHARHPARGICQLCNQPAPFCTRDGEPYLETYHIHRLSEGGEDVMENIVLLCPNCHRKMHVLDLPEDVAKLKSRFS